MTHKHCKATYIKTKTLIGIFKIRYHQQVLFDDAS